MRQLLRRAFVLIRQRRFDADLAEELNFHCELKRQELEQSGVNATDARFAIRRALGSIVLARDRSRDVWLPHWLQDSGQDLRFAWRGLRREWALSCVAVLTLAAGIIGTTTTFALVNGVLLRSLPVRDQNRVFVAWTELRSTGEAHWPFRVREVEIIRDSSRLLEHVAGVSHGGAGRLVTIENHVASYLDVAPVMGDFFDVLGLEPVLGRALSHTDDVGGAENVLVLTHGLWQRRYGGAPDVIGRHLIVGERPFTIVGVMPPDAEYPAGVEAWTTVAAFSKTLTNPEFRVDVDLIARIPAGVTIEPATTELDSLLGHLDSVASAGTPAGRTAVVQPFAYMVIGNAHTGLLLLFGAVGLVLVIACANVGNLLLLRSETRRGELAVRAALGAGRIRLARQLLAEGVIVAAAAGLVGITVSWWTLHAIVALAPEGLPRVDSIRIDARVLFFSGAIACLAAMLAGVAPALFAARTDVADELRSGGHSHTGRTGQRSRRVLVVAQVALAVPILVVMGLLTRSLWHLESVNIGYASNRLVFLELDLPRSMSADRTRHLQFLKDSVTALEHTPGIAAVTPVNIGPFSGAGGWELPLFTADGQDADHVARNPSLNLESVHPGYFDTFEVTLLRGRPFTNDDRADAPKVAIVSVDVAARTWPGGDPIGKRIKFGNLDSDDEWRTIVGVVTRTRYRELVVTRPTLYVPAEQFIVAAHMLVLRTTVPIAQLAGITREQLRLIDRDVHVMRIIPFEDLLSGPLALYRFNAALISMFGITGLLLASVGLYAVVAAFVRQRRKEIGIRLALGARPADVLKLVMVGALQLVGIGVVIGLASALSVTRVLQGLLFEITAVDPIAIMTAIALLVLAAVIASYLPARRATIIDPIVAIRCD